MDLLFVLGPLAIGAVILLFCCADAEIAKFDFERPHLNLDD